MIEFSLPSDQSDKYLKEIIEQTIDIGIFLWVNGRDIKYTIRKCDDKMLLIFDDECIDTLFLLTWTKNLLWMTPKKI